MGHLLRNRKCCLHLSLHPLLWLGFGVGLSVGWAGSEGWATPSLTSQCPDTLTDLMAQMLPDLPSYINRVRTRAGLTKSFITLAARPEFEPLSLPPFSTEVPKDDAVQQVFFTTLMRRYDGTEIRHLQEYHWLFLARSPKSPQAWQLVLLYSSIGTYPAAELRPLPPRNSSDGSTATAIRQWLADCQQKPLPTRLRLQPPKAPSPKM